MNRKPLTSKLIQIMETVYLFAETLTHKNRARWIASELAASGFLSNGKLPSKTEIARKIYFAARITNAKATRKTVQESARLLHAELARCWQ